MDFLLAILPILVLIAMLAGLKLPAWKAALIALATVVAEAWAWQGVGVKTMAAEMLKGVQTGLFPIGLVIVAALFTYAITVESGAIEDIKAGLSALSGDKRFFALLTVWGFGNFMEGMAGFGTAVAIPCAILMGVGFDPMKAVLCCLVANTTPTAFGSVGVPTMVLAGEAGLETGRLSATIACLQLAVTAMSPFFILFITDGWRGVKEKWGLALVADLAFLVPWLAVASFGGCELPDVVGGLCVMVTMAMMGDRENIDFKKQGRAWLPFGCVVAVLGISAMLPKAWKVSPGILILAAAFIGGLGQKVKLTTLCKVLYKTFRKYALAVMTICAVLALAKIMGAAGMTEKIAAALVKATGECYAAVSSVVGSLGGFVTGSGTSSNVLFGALQSSVGETEAQKYLFAAANVMGAGIGKMICPQSIVLGCAAAGLAGKESEVMKRSAPYFALVLLVACLVTFFASRW